MSLFGRTNIEKRETSRKLSPKTATVWKSDSRRPGRELRWLALVAYKNDVEASEESPDPVVAACVRREHIDAKRLTSANPPRHRT